ncbi:MAG: hypothetical protein FWD92_06770 [Methanomassiliicoccaceae archaeon]|nr:hypothetical protein [Methanomassiliicoccaceae archaeon]
MGFLSKLRRKVPKKDKPAKKGKSCSSRDSKAPKGNELNWTREQWQQHIGKKLTLKRCDTNEPSIVYELMKSVLCGDRVMLLMKDSADKEMVFEARFQEEFCAHVLEIDGAKIEGGYLSVSGPVCETWVDDVKTAP